MRSAILCERLLATIAAMGLLAGCASTPAPVVNHSFGPGEPASTQGSATTSQGATGTAGAQTFGLGHANGTTRAGGYTVAPGDTLYSIAFAHGMDVRELAALNDIQPPYVIRPGQVLKVRASASTIGPVVAAPMAAPVPAAPALSEPPPVAPAKPPAPVFGPVTTQAMTASGVAPSASSSSFGAVPAAPAPMPQPLPQVPPAPPPTAAATPVPGATRNVAGITWQWPAPGQVISGFQAGAGGDGAGIDIAGKLGDPVRAAASGTVVYSGNGLIGYGELVIIKHNDTYLSAYGHNSKRLVKEGDRVAAGQEIALMGASGAPRVELHFEIRKNGKPVDPMGFLPQR